MTECGGREGGVRGGTAEWSPYPARGWERGRAGLQRGRAAAGRDGIRRRLRLEVRNRPRAPLPPPPLLSPPLILSLSLSLSLSRSPCVPHCSLLNPHPPLCVRFLCPDRLASLLARAMHTRTIRAPRARYLCAYFRAHARAHTHTSQVRPVPEDPPGHPPAQAAQDHERLGVSAHAACPAALARAQAGLPARFRARLCTGRRRL